jgi:biotin synthase
VPDVTPTPDPTPYPMPGRITSGSGNLRPDPSSTRTYEERLKTLQNVRNTGVTVCSGGIVGMGETKRDRYALVQQLANQNPHPESILINQLVKVKGTRLQDKENLDIFDFVRMIATTRILMPSSYVRLSAGRMQLSDEAQALCFIAGANSIFMGDKLLTTPNPENDRDQQLLDKLGMKLFSESKHLAANNQS